MSARSDLFPELPRGSRLGGGLAVLGLLGPCLGPIPPARGFHLSAWALGLVGFPAVLVGLQWLRARRTPTRLEATGPVGHALNLAVFLVLYLLEPTSDAALLFYGASMWLAAVRGYAGCEVLAASNWLLGRDDQVGCALFWPVDQLEHHRTGQ
jgi:hypothetical protein